jgi:hypothetical protein
MRAGRVSCQFRRAGPPASLSSGVMPLPSQATIRVHSNESEWRFEWSGFDGDDCFNGYRLTVTENGTERSFDFGAAVVWSLRWLNRFFKDQSMEKTRGAISVVRVGQDFKLTFVHDGKQEEFHLKRPEVELDREFIPKYDGEAET